jgi:hypothetical protein
VAFRVHPAERADLTAWVAIGAWLVLAPVALYLVFARD